MFRRFGQDKAANLCEREPQLLQYPSANLRRKIKTLGAALQLTPEDSYDMLRRQPRLLTYDSETLVQRIEELRELLRLGHNAGDVRQLRKILTNRPSLLNKNPQTIAGLYEQMQVWPAAASEACVL